MSSKITWNQSGWSLLIAGSFMVLKGGRRGETSFMGRWGKSSLFIEGKDKKQWELNTVLWQPNKLDLFLKNLVQNSWIKTSIKNKTRNWFFNVPSTILNRLLYEAYMLEASLQEGSLWDASLWDSSWWDASLLQASLWETFFWKLPCGRLPC